MYTINIRSLKKTYGNIHALRGVNLQIPEGKIYGLIGSNGSGKTTLIKTIVGAIQPSSGSISVFGMDPQKNKWEIRKLIGYMPQTSSLFESLNIRDNITFFGKAYNLDNLDKEVNEIIEFTELKERENDPIYTFSGGMKKRVSLACALIHKPKLLLLDEPTAAVDPHLKARSWELFKELASRGTTLLISTHLMDEALLCDNITILNRGKVILIDTPDEILKKGESRLVINTTKEKIENFILSKPDAVASKLHEFGLRKDVKSIEIKQDTLEDIVLSEIKKNES
jgi:ABC-2 type transport system ATP-binding protein|tara:strand:- start:12682 stop:13530 length:849 start_codon:yes stop_codon:yes gene_type:complete